MLLRNLFDMFRQTPAFLLALRPSSCLPACQVIVADTFTNLAAQYLGPDALPAQRPFVLLVTGVLVLLMCFPRNLQALGEGGRQQASRQTDTQPCFHRPAMQEAQQSQLAYEAGSCRCLPTSSTLAAVKGCLAGSLHLLIVPQRVICA